MTYDDVLYDLKETLNINSDDKSFDFPDSFVLGEYATHRAFVITNTYNKSNRQLDMDIVQRFVLEFEPVDKGVCDLITGCYINRSKEPLPSRPIATHDGPMLKLTTPFVDGHQVKLVTQAKSDNVGNSPFTQNVFYAFYSSDGHIYLKGKNPRVQGVKYLALYGVFEDPQAISDWTSCSDTDCTRYPVKEAMHKTITEMTLEHLMLKYRTPVDEVNDASGQLRQPTAKE